jgi:DNA (cytosine-5)-methyltransferase 1
MNPLPLGSICSGYGGLELGIADVITVTTRWVADYEPPTEKHPNPKQGASIVLAHRFPDVPNLGDITAVAWPSTPRVRVVCGGTPCQDVSHAGARKGMRAGTRSGIWASMVDAITHHRPTLAVWENVGGALSAEADSNLEPCPICMGDERECNLRALGRVLGDLAEIGYDTAWCCVRASDVGAPHRRERVFVVAWPSDPDSINSEGWHPAGLEGQAGSAARSAGNAEGIGPVRPRAARGRGARSADAGEPATDPDSPGSQGPESARRLDLPDGCSTPDAYRRALREQPESYCWRCGTPILGHPDPDATADTAGDGRDERGTEPAGQLGRPDAPERGPVDWGPFAAAIRRWEAVLGRPAPPPTGLSTRGGQALSPAFVEWMMGLPAGWVTDVPGLTRNEQLKALGNGVVPQQAAHAVRFLLGFAPEWVRISAGLSTPLSTHPGIPPDHVGIP